MPTREELIQQAKLKHLREQAKIAYANSSDPNALENYAPTVQEQSPLISFMDREKLKWLAAEPEKGVAYIKSKHPEADVKYEGGQLKVRAPGEKEWRVDDPDAPFMTLGFLEDLPADIVDIGGDLLRGSVTGAASAGAAAMGGGLPGAMATGGLLGYQMEKGRQALGTLAGIPDNVSEDRAVMEGVLNAAAPGVGPLASGVYGKAKDVVLPRVASAMSGVPAEVYRDLGKNWARVAAMDVDPELLLARLRGVQEKVTSLAEGTKQAAGKAIGDVVEAAEKQGITINTQGMRKVISDAIGKARKAYERDPSPDNKNFYEDVMQMGKRISEETTDPATKVPYTPLPSPIKSAASAQELKQRLEDQIERSADSSRPGATSADKHLQANYEIAQQRLVEEMRDKIPGYTGTTAKYGPLKEMAKQAGKEFKDLPTTANTIRNLDKQGKAVLKARLETLAKKNPEKAAELAEDILAIQTQQYLGKPSSAAISTGGSTSTSRSVPMAGVGGLLGYGLGAQLFDNDIVARAAGAAGGTWLGAKAGSPATIKQIYGLLNRAEQLPRVPTPALYGVGRTAWDALRPPEYYVEEP